MSDNAMKDLYEVIRGRKGTFEEGSYTCYLFEKGLDKILKKCAEECGEVIIASKNYHVFESGKATESDKSLAKTETENEICDLLYHMMVLMVEQGIEWEDINSILSDRSKKIGNLKTLHVSDHNS